MSASFSFWRRYTTQPTSYLLDILHIPRLGYALTLHVFPEFPGLTRDVIVQF
jgi:hypothetical protein